MIVEGHRREERRRKEVGCQSEVAERRDAAVQVDLLTQQLSWRRSGVSCHCGAVQVDEPAGGALLQLCKSQASRCRPYTTDRPALLPSVPLFSEHKSSISPSMPPPTPADVSAAPPGLIAPLSPGLAEEEEQEEEEEVHVPEEERLCSENVEGGRWPDGGERQKSSLADKSTNHIAGKAPGKRTKLKMKLLEKDEESHTSKRGEKQTTRIQERKKNEGQEERGGEETMKEGGGVKSVIMKTEEAECRRPRRRMVGPTVRYLLESEQQSHGPTAANHSRVSRDVRRRKMGRPRKKQKELDDSSMVESSAEGGAERWWKLCQVCGLNFTSQASLDLHLSVHRPASSCAQAAADQQQEQTNDAQGDAEEREEPQRQRRTVCQPIRYLLESEETSHSSGTGNQTKATRRRGRSKDAVGGGASEMIDRPETNAKDTGHTVTTGGREEGEEEPHRTKRTMVGPPMRYLLESEEAGGRPKDVFDFNEAGGGASKMTDCSHTEDKETGHMVSTGGRREEEEPQRPGKTASALHPSVHRPKRPFGCHLCNRKFSRASRLFLHQCDQHHSNIGGLYGNGCGVALSNAQAPKNKREKQTTQDDKEEEPQGPRKPLLTAPTEAPYWSRDINRARTRPGWLVDYWTLNRRRNGRRGTKRSRVEEDDEEREAQQVCVEKEEEPQRPRRTMVGPPIRYLLESEETTRGSGTANQTNQKAANKHTRRRGRSKHSVGGGASMKTDCSDIEDKDTGHMVSVRQEEEEPLRPGKTVSSPIRCLLESEETSHDSETANQTDQEAVTKLTRRERSDAVGLCEAGGGASEMIDRLDAKVKDRSHVVEKGRRKGDEKKEEPQRLRRTMVGPPIRYLLESEELSRGQRTANQDTEDKPTHTRWSPKKTSVLHRPKRPFGCHICNRKFSCASRLFLHHCDQHRSIVDSSQGNRVGMAMSTARVSDGKRKEGAQGKDENGEEPPRQRRRRVGPPIRYLLESEELSHGFRTANQSAATKPTQRRERMKAIGLTKAGGGASQMIDRVEAAFATERQPGVHRQTYLVHRDLQDGHVTISPCSVTMQRLL